MKENIYYDYIAENINIGRNYSPIEGNPDFHMHNNYEIFLFLKGDVNYFVNNSCYHLEPGNILVFNNLEIHKTTNLTSEAYERLVIHFDPELIGRFTTVNTDLLACFQNHAPGINNIARLSEVQLEQYLKLAEQLKSSISCAPASYGGDILPLTYLLQLLIFLGDIYQNMPNVIPSVVSPKLKPLLAYIDRNITEELSLDKMSEDLSMSKFHLSRLFESNTGSTIYQYILAKRIAIAKQHLSEGRNVTEACQLSGFNDYSNFIRTFKKMTGISPGKYYKKFA